MSDFQNKLPPPRTDEIGLGKSAMVQSLCESCDRMREVVTPKGSRFLLCQLSQTNSAYPKYPPQPIVQCQGYVPKDKSRDSTPRSGN